MGHGGCGHHTSDRLHRRVVAYQLGQRKEAPSGGGAREGSPPNCIRQTTKFQKGIIFPKAIVGLEHRIGWEVSRSMS